MIPGMGHCAGGTGPNVVDMLSVIDTWVTEGKAPETIIASTAPVLGQKKLTRPLCPYPRSLYIRALESTDDAANFECKVVSRVHPLSQGSGGQEESMVQGSSAKPFLIFIVEYLLEGARCVVPLLYL
jgi:hypothetical protein